MEETEHERIQLYAAPAAERPAQDEYRGPQETEGAEEIVHPAEAASRKRKFAQVPARQQTLCIFLQPRFPWIARPVLRRAESPSTLQISEDPHLQAYLETSALQICPFQVWVTALFPFPLWQPEDAITL